MKKTIIISAVTVLLVLSFFLFNKYTNDPIAARNINACADLKPGITEENLIEALGPTIRVVVNNGQKIIDFKAPYFSAGYIRGVINPQTKQVVELYCGREGEPFWKMKN